MHKEGMGYKLIAQSFKLKRDQVRGLILDDYAWKNHFTPAERKEIIQYRKRGYGYKKIARLMGISRTNTRDYLLGRARKKKKKSSR